MTATVISGPPVDVMMLTHRAREQDMFVADWATPSPDTYRVGLRLPHDHDFYPPTPLGTLDPLLLVESMRHSSILISHAALGVPLDHHFMLQELEFDSSPTATRVAQGPVAMVLDVHVEKVRRSAGRPGAMSYEWVLRHGSAVAATGRARTRFCSPRVYRRLRDGRGPVEHVARTGPLLEPHQVGRSDERDVLLAPGVGDREWLLRVDTEHRTLFQRPSDHVPGMLLLEAARQAATAADSPRRFAVTGGHIVFHRYAELDEPCVLRAAFETGADGSRADAPRLPAKITAEQGGKPVFDCGFSARCRATVPPLPCGVRR
jgi:2-oxo-3-(phosphooxy)propyl 3-oxoalkanoate synthase